MTKEFTYKGYTCSCNILNDGGCSCCIYGLGGNRFLFSRDTLSQAENRFHEVVDHFIQTGQLLGA